MKTTEAWEGFARNRKYRSRRESGEPRERSMIVHSADAARV
jgi:hypothetical protein